MPKKNWNPSRNLPPPTIGLVGTFLNENYSSLPCGVNNLKNGHVVHTFRALGDRSATKTFDCLQKHFAEEGRLESFSRSRSTARIRRLIQRFEKKKRVNNPDDFKELSVLFSGIFSLAVEDLAFDASSITESDCSASVHASETFETDTEQRDEECTENVERFSKSPGSLLMDHPTTASAVSFGSVSPTRPSRCELTPRKRKLKLQLKTLAKKRNAEKQSYLKQIRFLKKSVDVKKQTQIRRLNQRLQRQIVKNATLREIRAKYKKLEKFDVDNALKLKKAHEQLLKSNKQKRVNITNNTYTAYRGMCISLKNKLDDVEKLNAQLQSEILQLEEKVEELEKDRSVIKAKDGNNLLCGYSDASLCSLN